MKSKKTKKIKATIINLKDKAIKGDASSTMILLVIKAEDQSITKTKGKKLFNLSI